MQAFDGVIGTINFPSPIEEDRGLAPNYVGTLEALGRRIEIGLVLSVVTAGRTPLNRSIWAEGTVSFYPGSEKEPLFEMAIGHQGELAVGPAASATWEYSVSDAQEVQNVFLRLLHAIAEKYGRAA